MNPHRRDRPRPVVTRYAFRNGPALRGPVLPMERIRAPRRLSAVPLALAFLAGMIPGTLVLLVERF